MLQLSPERKHYDVQTCSQVEGYHKKSHANSMQKKTQERVSIYPPPSFAAHRCNWLRLQPHKEEVAHRVKFHLTLV